MATITRLLSRSNSLSTFFQTDSFFSYRSSTLSFIDKPKNSTLKVQTNHTHFITKATANSSGRKFQSNEKVRIQKVHSIENFDEALRSAYNELVVVAFFSSHTYHTGKIYPFMMQLKQTFNDVHFLFVMVDESEKTRELCKRENVEKVPHFRFYKDMEKIHGEEGFKPDHLARDILYYGDNHFRVAQLHCREDIEKLIGDHTVDHKLVVLNVGWKNCGPCRKIYPTVIMLSRQMADTVAFARMIGDENESCLQFLRDMKVIKVPTFLFVKDGEICGRYVGSGGVKLIKEMLKYKGLERGNGWMK